MPREFQVIDTPQETLVNTTIPETKDPSYIQDRSEPSYTIGEEGVLIVHFSTDQFTDADGDELAAGTYTLPVKLKKDMIVFNAPLIDIPSTSAGDVTIDFTGPDGTWDQQILTALAADGVIDVSASLPVGTKPGEDLTISVTLAAAETSKSFVLYIPHIVGVAS